ncbi:MAG: hypothetical protein ABIF77_05545 [bacterium]
MGKTFSALLPAVTWLLAAGLLTSGLTDKYEVRAEGQGLTGDDGRWSCNRSYVQEGPEAADIVFVWVYHDVYGRKYETRLLDDGGRANLTIGMGF